MSMDDHNDFFLEEQTDSPAAAPEPAPVSRRGEPDAPRPRRRVRKFMIWTVTVALVVVAAVFYVRYLNPYAVEARATGYVTSLEKQGIVFKTFEGSIATESYTGDTARVHTRDLDFTVRTDSLAYLIQNLSTPPARRVTLVYERYYGTLPWRGSSKNVVTAVIPD